ncbi:MAG: DUF4412 domain-containing protein [Deltaproteobacteria bacterium]|nr:DUF4412 domain-containing protein [Deltaproteobacteria bacterium]
MKKGLAALVFLFAVVFIGCFAVTADTAYAGKMKEPDVEYSALNVMETEQAAIQGMVYSGRGKTRNEMEMGGAKSISIIRKDKKVVWTLMPDQNMYMETPFTGNTGKEEALTDMDVEQSVVGEETVNGVKATKYKMIATRKDGTKLGGFSWVTKEGIVVKADMIAKDGKSKTRIKMELKDLKIGRQDPSLFELPAGYNKLDMGGMGGMNMDEMMKGRGKGRRR